MLDSGLQLCTFFLTIIDFPKSKLLKTQQNAKLIEHQTIAFNKIQSTFNPI